MQIDYYVKRMIRSIFALLILVEGSRAECSSGGNYGRYGCNSGKYCAGYYRDFSGNCKTCPTGYYCLGGPNQAKKIACVAGKYSDVTGATSASTQ